MPNSDISRGFRYVCIIYIAGRIRAAVRVRAGDIKFFSLGGPVGDETEAHTVIFRFKQGCDGSWIGRGAGNIIYQSPGGPVERYTPLAA